MTVNDNATGAPLGAHARALLRAHYGDGFDMAALEADLAAGLVEVDFEGLEREHGAGVRRALLDAMTDHERALVLAYVAGRWPQAFDEAVDGSPSADAAELLARGAR